MRRAGLVLAVVAVVAAGWIAAQPGAFSRSGNLCDGSVPVWYPSEGGCSEVPSLGEHVWPPERWGAPSFCQRMCIGELEDFEEEIRVRDEWRAAHPGAMAAPEFGQ